MDAISQQILRASTVRGNVPVFLMSQQMVYVVTNGILLFNIGAVVDIHLPNLNPAANFSITGYLSKNFSKNTHYIHTYIYIYIYIYIYTHHFEFSKLCI